MIAGIFPFALNSRRAASSIAFIAVTLLATARHASAQAFVDTLQSCGLRKGYAVTMKLLAVYASHILTVKVEPGLGTLDTLQLYVAAALLPSSSAHIPITDLTFVWIRPWVNGANQSDRKLMLPWKWTWSSEVNHRKNMQMAINCGATCVRVKRADIPPGADARVVPTSYSVRADLLQADEEFIMVPRGTPAEFFVRTMIQSRSSAMKALIGGIQIYFATLQLLSVADLQVAAYGYGAFTYTIIPYALGSAINLISLCLTGNYVDLTELKIIDSEADTIRWNSEDIKENIMFGIGLFELAVYLSVVGGITGFRSGISSSAQRGWFMSWAIIGTFYGVAARTRIEGDEPEGAPERTREQAEERNWDMRALVRRAQSMIPMAGRKGDIVDERAGDGLNMVERGADRLSMAEGAGNVYPTSQRANDESEKGGDRLRMAGVGDGLLMIEEAGDGLPVDDRAGNEFSVAEKVGDELQKAGDELSIVERGSTRSKLSVRSEERLTKALLIVIFGVPTVGGIVTMIQQYMNLYQC